MSNCDQNCEAVSGLNDYAANLIEYIKRIDKWVNGGQEEFVQVGGVPTPTLRNLAMSIKALMGVHPDNKTIFINQDKEIYVKLSALLKQGGGLALDDNGQMYVDVSKMNTEIFQNLMSTIKVPIWLTSDTTFYVNQSHPNAGDNIVDGRGTINMPFSTIQACINYVTNNFNIVGFVATIRIAAGTYNENLTLGIYSRTTGYIVLTSYVGAENQVNIKMSGTSGLYCPGGPYYIRNINPSMRPIYNSSVWTTISLCAIDNGGELHFRSTQLSMTDMSGISDSADYEFRMFACYGNGLLVFDPAISGENPTSISFNMKDQNKVSHILHGERGANIQTSATNLDQSHAMINCSGTCTDFLRLSNAKFTTVAGATYHMKFSGNVIGQRYSLINGASCLTNNDGENYFPGNAAGFVQDDTYCWYK